MGRKFLTLVVFTLRKVIMKLYVIAFLSLLFLLPAFAQDDRMSGEYEHKFERIDLREGSESLLPKNTYLNVKVRMFAGEKPNIYEAELVFLEGGARHHFSFEINKNKARVSAQKFVDKKGNEKDLKYEIGELTLYTPKSLTGDTHDLAWGLAKAIAKQSDVSEAMREVSKAGRKP